MILTLYLKRFCIQHQEYQEESDFPLQKQF